MIFFTDPAEKVQTTVLGEMSSKILELAKKQRMNTGIRKSIFCVIMTSEVHSLLWYLGVFSLYREGWNTIYWLNAATFLYLSPDRMWISNIICHVQWFEFRGDCLFCWYWWNCWPSLFKLSFHDVALSSVYLCVKKTCD